jgi:hypothetical protein
LIFFYFAVIHPVFNNAKKIYRHNKEIQMFNLKRVNLNVEKVENCQSNIYIFSLSYRLGALMSLELPLRHLSRRR